jgi:diguanylate cyclase (GGDEF)-like protein
LHDRLKQTMAASVRDERCCALLFIDLDNFKTLNDTSGHDMGDLLLQQVAQRLLSCVREEDTVARLGGDEFVVLITRLSSNKLEAASQMEVVSSHILSTLDKIYPLKEMLHRSTASIGVSLFDGQSKTIDDLMKQADLAMYRAKEEGRNGVRFFDPTMESAVRNRAALETDLRQAIEEEQFMLFYQPQIMDGDHLTGSEALVRWHHPQRGMVSPAEFIPLAEETGLILPLGHWVLEAACRQLALWATQPNTAHLTLAVNVSARQFQQTDFCEQVQDVLTRTGANPHRLKLELTESMLVSQVDQVIDKMLALKTRGIAFSLDDFGTGFSSLAYLKLLPLDQLKIDQTFVRDVASNPNDAAIAKTIIGLAKALGLGVIAEGVETQAQREFLASAGCLNYQGYYFSRPLPLADFEAFAQSHSQPALST